MGSEARPVIRGTAAACAFVLLTAPHATADAVRLTPSDTDAARLSPAGADTARLAPADAGTARVTHQGWGAVRVSTAPAEPVGGPLLAGRGLIVQPGPGAPKLGKFKASGWVIADATSGEVLAAKNPHGHFMPASTIKTLTALTLVSRLDPKKKIKPSQHACNTEGSAVGLTPKVTYTVDDLLKGLMMSSGNDAAMALAEAYGGMKPTLDAMNAEARRIQANDTVARTPHGLDAKGQRTSPYDLALMAREGLKNPRFRTYVGTKVTKFPAPKGKSYQIQNHNKLLWQYKGGIGVKNGWTNKARASFVGAATRNGRTVIAALMHSEPPFWDDVKAMLTWGFEAKGKVTPIGRLVDPIPPRNEAAEQAPPASPAAAAQPGPKPPGGPSPALLAAGGAGAIGLSAAAVYLVRRRRRADDTVI
ncbi:D-alanyl-D-alanine carboxypeptidase family protein [Bailinhaonella thermotolerans]|uniref:D-alanyl-D-alanine carboxypeptidase n=1 Tax=Bailinhaonella thermotolerans TaxID=1070861 RepID=A0A3A4A572_9ACTN|nr:D-alanyl-D-alanine carboxypeptidase family protein [Bailinhaonella thermotolerans]RJL23665.1 D-alanyl-D-alanine carboxypeptidase [Bailinhaonella thermotolerans]